MNARRIRCSECGGNTSLGTGDKCQPCEFRRKRIENETERGIAEWLRNQGRERAIMRRCESLAEEIERGDWKGK